MIRKKIYFAMFIWLFCGSPFFATVTDTDSVYETAQSRRRQRINTDMFLGHWGNSKVKTEFGSLKVSAILTKCHDEPLAPTEKGAVLTDLNAVSYASLKPKASTRKSKLKDRQFILYIDSGEGTIESQGKSNKLFDGIGVIIPPDVNFSLSCTGSEPLTMYIVEEPVSDNFTPREKIIVRYEYDNLISTNRKRVDISNFLFNREHGLAVLSSFNPVHYEPMTYIPPHVHPPGVEEVWIMVKGSMYMQLGRQRRKFVEGSAYKVPANARTPHTNINDTDVSKKLIWMMKVPLIAAPRPSDGNKRDQDGLI